MNRSSSLRNEIYGSHRGDLFKKQSHRRSRSLPALKGQISVQEKEVRDGSPQRSRSMRDRVKQLPKTILKAPFSGDAEYDSDEEDRKNGVPITVSEDNGCALTLPLLEKIVMIFKDSVEEKHSLTDLHAITKQRYFKAYNWFSQSHYSHWNASTRHYFKALEDRYYQLTYEKDMLDSEISHLEAMLLSFMDHGSLSKAGKVDSSGEGESMAWSSSNTYDRFQNGEILPLEYGGKDYNSI